MRVDQIIYEHIEKLTNLLDRVLNQDRGHLGPDEEDRLKRVYHLIDHSLLKELQECDFLKKYKFVDPLKEELSES